jgi:multidrug efflux system membrane fusion protein
VENARVQLSYCSVKSPIAGRTGNLSVTAGNIVKANEGQLVTVNQIAPIYVTFSVPEKNLAELRSRMNIGNLRIEAVVPGRAEQEQGTVTFIDNTVDTATGTIKLKGTFANKAKGLWPGQFATVIITLKNLSDAVVVPSQSVQTGQQGVFVFVVKSDATAEIRPVKTGVTYQGVTVIESGLQQGETVVTDGQMRLAPGAQVTVKKNPASGELKPVTGANPQKQAAPAGSARP